MRAANRLLVTAVTVALIAATASAGADPYFTVNAGLDRVAKDHGGGKRSATGSGEQRLVYSEHWFGLKHPVTASYVQAEGAKSLSRTVLRLPTPLADAVLTKALQARAGLPAGRAVRKSGHLTANWIWHAAAYHLDSTREAKTVTTSPALFRGGATALTNAVVLQDIVANVAGRGRGNEVILAGIPFERGSIWMKSLYLVLRDPKGNAVGDRVFALGFGGLFVSEVLVRDFTGDGQNEILVSAPTGGSGGLSQYSLVSLKGAVLKPLVDSQALSHGPTFTVTFLDGFKARVKTARPGGKWTLDLHPYKDEYVKSGVYAADGRLLKPTSGAVDGVGLLTIRGSGNRPTLVASQKIWGTYHANSIGTAIVRWRWRHGALRIVGVRVHPT